MEEIILLMFTTSQFSASMTQNHNKMSNQSQSCLVVCVSYKFWHSFLLYVYEMQLFSVAKETHYINWGILLSLFQKIPKIPKTTPVDGFQHMRGQCGVVFHAPSNGEVNVQIS